MTVPVRPLTGMQPGTQPGQGGQQQPVHPTVGNLGLPGSPVTIEQPRSTQAPLPPPQGSQWQMPPAPQQQQQTFPQQQAPAQWLQQQQPQQPQQQYTQQNPPPGNQPVQRVAIPDNVVLDGENVPAHLRGRTWGQIKQIHTALEQDFVSRQQPRLPQQQQAPQQIPQPRGGRPNGIPEEAQDFWSNPIEAIGRVVDERVNRAIAPVTQRTTAMAIQEAQNVARAGIADYQILEAEVIQTLNGVPPEALADPRTWQNAADLARGRLMSRGQYQAPQPQPNGQQQFQANPQYQRGPGAFVPAPVSPVGQFFTEQPTPPSQDSQLNTITQDEAYYAQKMNMTPQEYVAWRGGVVRESNARRY